MIVMADPSSPTTLTDEALLVTSDDKEEEEISLECQNNDSNDNDNKIKSPPSSSLKSKIDLRFPAGEDDAGDDAGDDVETKTQNGLPRKLEVAVKSPQCWGDKEAPVEELVLGEEVGLPSPDSSISSIFSSSTTASTKKAASIADLAMQLQSPPPNDKAKDRQSSLLRLRGSGVVWKSQKFLQEEAFGGADNNKLLSPDTATKKDSSIATLKKQLTTSSSSNDKTKERENSLLKLRGSGVVWKSQKFLEEEAFGGGGECIVSPNTTTKKATAVAELKLQLKASSPADKARERENSLLRLRQSGVVWKSQKFLQEEAFGGDNDSLSSPGSIKKVASIADLKLKLRKKAALLDDGGDAQSAERERENSLKTLRRSGIVKSQRFLMEERPQDETENEKPKSAIKGIVDAFGGSKKQTVVQKHALALDGKTKEQEKLADSKSLIKSKWVDTTGKGTYKKKYVHKEGMRGRKSLEELP